MQHLKIIEALVNEGFHVVASDVPAHGNSTANRTSAFYFMEVLILLGEKFGSVHTYIGYYMGGLVLMNLLAVGFPISNMILLSTPSDGTSSSNSFLNIIRGSKQTEMFIYDFIQKKYGKTFDSLFSVKIPVELSKRVLVIHDKKVPFSGIQKIKTLLPQASFYFREDLGHTRILYG